MELRQLKYFLAVADARSFVSAANKLYISRQAISKAVSQLEAELDVELFMRGSNGAFLTPAGVVFYERVRNTMLELEQLQAEMRQLGTRYHQTARLAFSVGTLHLYEEALQGFLQQKKHIHVEYWECTPEACQDLLLERKVDAAITSCEISAPQFHTRQLDSWEYGVLLRENSKLNTLDRVDAHDLSWLPLACFADGQTERFCKTSALNPRYTGIDLLRLVSMAREGRCATLLPQGILSAVPDGCCWLPLQTEARWHIGLVCLQSLENNSLLYSALDELALQVFGSGL